MWLRRSKRWLLGYERLRLQGVDVIWYGTPLREFTDQELSHMAGNAINFFCFVPAFLAALAALPWFGK